MATTSTTIWKPLFLRPVTVTLLMVFLVMYESHVALAASGGRVGGQCFSRRSSSSLSSLRSSSIRRSGDRGSTHLLCSSCLKWRTQSKEIKSPYRGVIESDHNDQVECDTVICMLAGLVLLVSIIVSLAALLNRSGMNKTSVIKLQVGLPGMARSIQRDLNWIGETAYTSSPRGLHKLLIRTISSLERHPTFCISAYSTVDVKRNLNEGEKKFNQLSLEERGKFDEETLVNVNNRRRKTTRGKRAIGISNEYIVITILVAAQGVYALPAINSSRGLKVALRKLASIFSGSTKAVEVLWTPQDENDVLSKSKFLQDYPMLRPIRTGKAMT